MGRQFAIPAFAALFLAATAVAQSLPVSSTPAGLRGQTEPVATVEVPAAVKGILAEVNVKEGQSIKKGDQLVRLDDSLQKEKVEIERVGAESNAAVQYAQNQLEFARRELEQIKRLSQAPAFDVQQKELAVRQAEQGLVDAKDKQSQAAARYKVEQITLEHMTLRSPIDGSVLRVKKQVGEQTDENPVVIVVQTSKLNAIFYPDKELFGRIAVGDKVPLEFEGLKGKGVVIKREGVVVAVDPVMDPVSQRFRVKMEVENIKGDLAGGVTVYWNPGR